MKIAVVDKQNDFNNIIKEILEQLQIYDLEVCFYSNIKEMEQSYISFYLIFLNDTKTHIIYAKENTDKNIVFISYRHQKTNDVFSSNVYGFIRKDDSITKYKEIIEHIMKRILNRKIVVFKINNYLEKFILNEIVYLQYIGERTVGFIYNKQQYLVKNCTLKDIKEKLDDQFIYIDRNTLVNLCKIVNIYNKEIGLNGIRQPFKVSKRRMATVVEKYSNEC